jgi:Leucine-rich repeat (LRR) protein
MSIVTPKLLSKEEIDERFDLSQYDMGNLDNERILLYDGDTTVTGDLDRDWATAVLQQLGEDTSLGEVLIMVNGNLTVMGDIVIGDYHPLLLVLGNVYCDVLQSGDETIHITGDAHIKYAFYGYYNDGSIIIEGKTYVPYVLNADHSSSITPEGAILINTYSDHNDFFEYDYTSEALPTVAVPAAFDDKGEFNEWQFIELVRSGQSPFVEGAKPTRLVYEEELEAITSGNVEEVIELDWSDKKLKVFPPSLTKLKNLKKLTLSKNNISEIPAAIGELLNLEELYLQDCGVHTIAEAIGNCKKLRVWDLSANHDLKAFPDSIGDLSNLQVLNLDYIATPLPESLARLEKLEEISMYSCFNDLENPGTFPEVLTRLKNLKRWDFRENKISVLPESILQIQTLEAFLWTGSLTQNHTHNIPFPDFTRFPNLKKLVISRKWNSWKEVVFNMPALEHLAIDRNKEEKQYFDQNMLDTWAGMMAGKDDAFRNRIQWILDHKQQEPDGRFSYLVTAGMKPGELQEINKLKHLKYLDLSYNDLPSLPETFFGLQQLETLDLRYNKFPEELQERINQAFPTTKITWKG